MYTPFPHPVKVIALWLYIGMFFFVSTGDFSEVLSGRFQIGIEWHLYNLLQKQTPLHTLSLHGSLFRRCDSDNNIGKAVKGMILLSGKHSQHRRYKPFVGHILYSVLILFEDLYFRISGNMVSLIPFQSCQNLSSVNNIYVKDANSENWNKIPNCILKSHPNFVFGQIKRNLHLLDYQPFELNSLPFE